VRRRIALRDFARRRPQLRQGQCHQPGEQHRRGNRCNSERDERQPDLISSGAQLCEHRLLVKTEVKRASGAVTADRYRDGVSGIRRLEKSHIVAATLNPRRCLNHGAAEQAPIELDSCIDTSAPFDATIEEHYRASRRLKDVSQLKLPGERGRVGTGVLGKRTGGIRSNHRLELGATSVEATHLNVTERRARAAGDQPAVGTGEHGRTGGRRYSTNPHAIRTRA